MMFGVCKEKQREVEGREGKREERKEEDKG